MDKFITKKTLFLLFIIILVAQFFLLTNQTIESTEYYSVNRITGKITFVNPRGYFEVEDFFERQEREELEREEARREEEAARELRREERRLQQEKRDAAKAETHSQNNQSHGHDH